MALDITACIWMDDQAEEAAAFYVKVFENSRIVRTAYYPENTFKPAGSVLTVELELDGRRFTLLNGGPGHPLTEAISFEIHCDDQAEIDRYWELLTGGGEEIACGWVKDRFGVSWQVIPRGLNDLVASPDKKVAQRVFDAMMPMVKLDKAALEAAARG